MGQTVTVATPAGYGVLPTLIVEQVDQQAGVKRLQCSPRGNGRRVMAPAAVVRLLSHPGPASVYIVNSSIADRCNKGPARLTGLI